MLKINDNQPSGYAQKTQNYIRKKKNQKRLIRNEGSQSSFSI